MTRHQRRFDDADLDLGERRRGVGMGSIVLATAIGVGIGLLAAPEPGLKTRRRLRRRLSELGADLGEVQGLSGRAREGLSRARQRGQEAWDDRFGADEEEGSAVLSTALAVAAGIAATYLFSAERAAPARTRMRETAESVRREATDRWERYQQRRRQGGANGQDNITSRPGETGLGSIPSNENPHAS